MWVLRGTFLTSEVIARKTTAAASLLPTCTPPRRAGLEGPWEQDTRLPLLAVPEPVTRHWHRGGHTSCLPLPLLLPIACHRCPKTAARGELPCPPHQHSLLLWEVLWSKRNWGTSDTLGFLELQVRSCVVATTCQRPCAAAALGCSPAITPLTPG